MQNAMKNTSLHMATLEHKKADENVMKLAEDQRVTISFVNNLTYICVSAPWDSIDAI